jgi:hypothetical protein
MLSGTIPFGMIPFGMIPFGMIPFGMLYFSEQVGVKNEHSTLIPTGKGLWPSIL